MRSCKLRREGRHGHRARRGTGTGAVARHRGADPRHRGEHPADTDCHLRAAGHAAAGHHASWWAQKRPIPAPPADRRDRRAGRIPPPPARHSPGRAPAGGPVAPTSASPCRICIPASRWSATSACRRSTSPTSSAATAFRRSPGRRSLGDPELRPDREQRPRAGCRLPGRDQRLREPGSAGPGRGRERRGRPRRCPASDRAADRQHGSRGSGGQRRHSSSTRAASPTTSACWWPSSS